MSEGHSTLNEFLQRIPKIELHCHFLGTICKETMKDLARKNGSHTTDAEIDAFYVRGEKPIGVLHISGNWKTTFSKPLMTCVELAMSNWKTPRFSRFDMKSFSGTRQAH